MRETRREENKRLEELNRKRDLAKIHNELTQYNNHVYHFFWCYERYPHKKADYIVFGEDINEPMVEEQHVAFEELLTKKSVIECFVDYIEETDYDAEKIKMYRYRHLDLPSAFTIAPTDEIKENDDNEVEHPEWNDWIARIIELTEKCIL